LIDNLKAYNPNIDMLYYTACFVDGLSEDICAVIVVQRPPNLDTVYTLALLQEEVADSSRCKDPRHDVWQYTNPQFQTAHQVPAPAAKITDGGFTVPANAKTPEERYRPTHLLPSSRTL
jgi:hypothetical protein